MFHDIHQHHTYQPQWAVDYNGPELGITELFPNEGLDAIYNIFPTNNSSQPANTWLGLFTANTASGAAADNGGGGVFNNGGTVAISASTIAE